MTTPLFLNPNLQFPDEDWRQHAECRYGDPELFFPRGDGAPGREQEKAAKKICDRCPVVAECLDWALERRVRYGIWGGKSLEERAAVNVKRGRRKTL